MTVGWPKKLGSQIIEAMRPISESDPMDVAARLTTLRLAVGPKVQSAFAVKYGFTARQWNNYEMGASLPAPAAIRLCQKIPDLSLDWLYFGNVSGLGVRLLQKIESVENGSADLAGAERNSVSSSQR